jgi:3',5'-cyclic AMP phosphodiesterase CpdA
MDDPISPARRTLLKAGAATLATPVAAAIAQPAAAVGHQEAKSFDLWVISDQHVGTDKAASEGIQHGLVGFRPPPVRAESLATALRQSEEGGAFGGLSFNWDIALNLGDYAGFWDAPEDEQGREVVRQYSVLKKHRREQVYNIAGNHDASPHGHPANEGKETNWWFRKWCDPAGEHTETSGVDPNKRPYPIDGTWERYTFKVGNIRFLMMGDRNDLPYPVGRRASGGASPAGAVTPETFAWWTSHVESAGKDEIIITGAHHMLRETTVGSGDYEGVSRNPDGTFRSGRYHGPDGAPEGASYLYFLGDKPKAQAFENYLAAHPGAIDLWVGGHTHTHPDDVLNGRSHVERKWGVNFVNCAQLSKFHSYVTCPPMSRHFTFTEGSRLVRVRCYLHDDTHAAEGWYPPAERVLEFSKPFYWD